MLRGRAVTLHNTLTAQSFSLRLGLVFGACGPAARPRFGPNSFAEYCSALLSGDADGEEDLAVGILALAVGLDPGGLHHGEAPGDRVEEEADIL